VELCEAGQGGRPSIQQVLAAVHLEVFHAGAKVLTRVEAFARPLETTSAQAEHTHDARVRQNYVFIYSIILRL